MWHRKPVSAMRVAGSGYRLRCGGFRRDRADPDPAGYHGGSGGYRSLLGAFELGASSPRIPTAKLRVRIPAWTCSTGAASNVAALKAAGADTSEARLSFGISTWGNWQEVTSRGTYYVFIDTDKDGTSDCLQTVREKGLDYLLVKVSKRSNGKWQAIENALYPPNGTWGDTDTNIMDLGNTLVMTVLAERSGLTRTPNRLRLRTGDHL